MKSHKESQELKLTMPWGHVAGIGWGCPRNNPVLLVHGTLDNAGSFTRLIQLLPENYYYVAIDLPGHGLSSHFSPGIILDFFNYILTIKYVLDQLQWSKCMYIGHSFGAQLGIMFSIVYPNILTRIITFDGLLPRAVNEKNLLSRIKQVNDSVLYDLNEKKTRLYTKIEVLNALQNRRQFTLNEQAALSLFERSVSMVGDMYKYNRDLRIRPFIYPNFNFNQYAELMNHLKLPVLVILATDSWFNLFLDDAASLQSFKKILPNTCTIVTVEGNHDVHNNNPERVVSYVSSFLNNNIKSKL
ncbi:hypothetical protein PV325_005858 [Microctonus aethiopoides]|uniref:AB hydrolase-1 domain-containing protein n=1 Tax=Microctonus aethiopoides TaxID=144406 RepID=A0AA39FYY8_9HYME|nr:hypothetical protein PV325_005858 [Microctonus aethiopoides]KAK0091289.1 hypothetical protein PV326_003464 [Microctonus aethiopoides]KAK0178442.1 hypothetical protein PV328_002390 [Microctonus aethiopoides]